MQKTPFRVLFREFLFRTVDLELLTPKGDTSKLLGQIAALLIFASIAFAFPALGLGSARNLPAPFVLFVTYSGEHFMIATTMLVTGLLAVLSWDSTFPNKRDVFVLLPLPLPTRTLFLAKVSAVAVALSLTVLAIHAIAGLAWPVALHSQAVAQPEPVLTYEEALPPVGVDDLKTVLDRDLAQALKPATGAIAPETGVGVTIGVLKHGSRRTIAYGAAQAGFDLRNRVDQQDIHRPDTRKDGGPARRESQRPGARAIASGSGVAKARQRNYTSRSGHTSFRVARDAG